MIDEPTSRPAIAAGRRRARGLAVAAAIPVTVACLLAWFTVDTRIPRETGAFYASAILLLVSPLLFAARRLGRDNDALGALVAGIVSVLIITVMIFGPLWLLARSPAESRGWSFYLVVGLLMPPFDRLTATAGLALIVFAILAVDARRVWRSSSRRQFRVGADGLATVGLMLLASAGVRSHPLTVTRTGPYDPTTAQHELLHVYTCLWRVAGAGAVRGFPATLGGCEWPDAAPGSAAYGSGYQLEYHPIRIGNDNRALGFSLVTTDAGHRNGESFYLDESGTVRRAIGQRATATSPVWIQTGCSDLESVVRALEQYRSAHPAIGYPLRIGRYDPGRDSSGDGVLRSLMVRPADSITATGDGETTIGFGVSGRALIFHRFGDRYTLSLFTKDSLPLPGATLMDDPRLDRLRNFFQDSAGELHVTGEQRPATMADPVRSATTCN